MSSITSSVSDNTIKFNYLGSSTLHVIRPYTNTPNDSDTKYFCLVCIL